MAKYHIKATESMTIEQAEQWINSVCENNGLELVCASVTPNGVYHYFKESKESELHHWPGGENVRNKHS